MRGAAVFGPAPEFPFEPPGFEAYGGFIRYAAKCRVKALRTE